jgi:hypothetical protein
MGVSRSKGHITCDYRDLMYIRCCENPSRLSDSAKPQFLVSPSIDRNSNNWASSTTHEGTAPLTGNRFCSPCLNCYRQPGSSIVGGAPSYSLLSRHRINFRSSERRKVAGHQHNYCELFGLFRDWQRTQTQSSVTALPSLRQQTDVRFCWSRNHCREANMRAEDSINPIRALSRARPGKSAFFV